MSGDGHQEAPHLPLHPRVTGAGVAYPIFLAEATILAVAF